MRHWVGRIAFGGVVASVAIGCSLLTNLDGLAGGEIAPNGPGDGSADSALDGGGEGGTSTDGAACTQTSDPTLLSDAIGLAAGADFTCALRANGTVACWGENGLGQLGTPGSSRPTPVAVPGLSGITAIVAGDAFACALDSGGSMWCWGDNAAGQLGKGNASAGAHAPSRVGTTGNELDKVTAMDAGGRHACAIREGSILCWGANDFGQLGGSLAPFIPAPVGSISGAVDLSLGGNYTCVVADDPSKAAPKAILCWGQNDDAQLGFSGGATPMPQRIQMLVGTKDALPLMCSGFGHTCARDGSNHLLCWGENDFGQLGPGLSPGPGSPAIQTMNAFGVVRMAAAGDDFTCALGTDGKVQCLGLDSQGQLGNGTQDFITTDGGSYPSHTGVTGVTGLPPAERLAAGGAHTCAILTHPCPAQGGRVMCWGKNDAGELGSGSTDRSLVPVSVRAP
jgi:alpha-tubulin suppressor-like RCC1 family protein